MKSGKFHVRQLAVYFAFVSAKFASQAVGTAYNMLCENILYKNKPNYVAPVVSVLGTNTEF